MARVPVRSLAYSTFRDFAHWKARYSLHEDEVVAMLIQRFAQGPLKNVEAFMSDEELDRRGSLLLNEQVRNAKVVLASGQQLDAFKGVALPAAPLKMPFPSVWVEFEKSATNHDGTAVVVGVLAYDPWYETMPGELILAHVLGFSKKFGPVAPQETLQLPMYINTAALVYPAERTLAYYGDAMFSRTGNRDRDHFSAALSFLYLLSAQNVRLEYTDGPTALNKKRVSRGKPPIPGYYNVVFTDAPKHQPHATGMGISPGVRFDVRGHWRVLTKDREEPKYVWVHPHQRGLKNAVYRPSVWALRDAQ
jgi:hypothetical protein